MAEDSPQTGSNETAPIGKVVAGGGSSPQKMASGGAKETAYTIPTKTTKPKEHLRHDISDDELTMLADSNRDGLSNAMWGLLGIAGGCLFTVIEKAHDAFFAEKGKEVTLTGMALVEICIFAASLAGAISILIVARNRSKTSQSIASEIRNRKKY